MANLFYNIYKTISLKKRVGFLVAIVIFLGLGYLASFITFEEDITKLIPTNNKNSQAQKVLKTVNFADKIIVNFTKETNGSVDDLTSYASEFIDSLKTTSGDYYTKIQGKIADEDVLNTLDFVYENLPLFLDNTDYKNIEEKLHTDSVKAITKANYKTLISPSGFVAKETILKDPFGISFMGLKKLQQLSFGDAFSLHNGFLLSKDKKHVLLFISPTHESSETAENSKFSEILYRINNNLNDKYKTKVNSEYFGGALIAVENAKQIKKDIQLTVSIAMSILLIILIVFYRKLALPIILFVPTIFGGLLAVALLFLIRTKISAISLGIGSVLLGVTLDYSLHVLTHIRSNNNVKALFHEITKPILMSSLTTALAFLCLLFVKSQALQDLGIFAAISVIGASIFALIFIPQVYKDVPNKVSKNTFIDKLASFPLHKSKWSFIVLAILLGVSLFTYKKVTFNHDITKLNYEPPALMAAQKRLDALTNVSSKSVYLASYGNTKQEAINANDAVLNKLKLLKANKQIINYSSVGALVQSDITQKNRIQKWQSFWNDSLVNKTKTSLIENGASLGFKPTTHNDFYSLLESDFSPLQISDYNALKMVALDDYITTKNNFTTVTSLVKVSTEQATDIVNAFKDQPNVLVIDRQQMNETFLGNLKDDFNRLVQYCFVVVLVILLLFYRSVSLTLVTAIPIALTWFLTIGLMGLFGIEFNIFNIIISTFIFGLGVDYCIFITYGLLHEYRTGETALPTHKTSIILSVITTILGVGVLILAKHPALYTMSLVSIVGILSAITISFIIQPVLFKLLIGSKNKKPYPLLLLIQSTISFTYYGLGGLVLSIIGVIIIKVVPVSMKKKMAWFHGIMSKFMKSVLDSYPYVKTKVINNHKETFDKQCVIIANHTSFLDILAIGMLHPKIIFLVNDWVYNSPIFGKAVRLVGFYPVSSGIENGVAHLQKKVDQGYSLMAFPEGTRSYTNKIRRFHKGAFYLAEQFKLDIVPVVIHGNSEILPKGRFVIKRGTLTVEILKRIQYGDSQFFGETTKETTKNISTYFKQKFQDIRKRLENDTYFHNVILEDFRYKGSNYLKDIKQDLNTNKSDYKKIIDTVGKRDRILHISKDNGQLDFLLSLDSPDRSMTTLIKDTQKRAIAKNCYISNNHSKIQFTNSFSDMLNIEANTIIINSDDISELEIESVLEESVTCIILLKQSCLLYPKINTSNFTKTLENNQLIILTK
ncbi:MMPL family transporter [Corallibacter sp.]|uniref:MMPL family transporter n=1 Tax=Corallibacter sp. TaxID=2038084 RepID=UPI003AB475A6